MFYFVYTKRILMIVQGFHKTISYVNDNNNKDIQNNLLLKKLQFMQIWIINSTTSELPKKANLLPQSLYKSEIFEIKHKRNDKMRLWISFIAFLNALLVLIVFKFFAILQKIPCGHFLLYLRISASPVLWLKTRKHIFCVCSSCNKGDF